MTNLTLYWLIPKDRSSRVRWLLRELDLEFSEQQMNASDGEHRSGDYLDVNPFGKVPAIVTDDLTLSESGAILLYLLETLDTEHSFSPRRDTEQWPIFLQWVFWGLTTFESAVFAYNSFEDRRSFKIEATVTDRGGLSDGVLVAIDLVDRNEPPNGIRLRPPPALCRRPGPTSLPGLPGDGQKAFRPAGGRRPRLPPLYRRGAAR